MPVGKSRSSKKKSDSDSEDDDNIDSGSESDDSHQEKKKKSRKKTKKKHDEDKKTSKKKNGPGRPRKEPKKEPIPRNGIVSTPKIEEAVVEFLYDSPVIMKKIISFFKAIAATQIQIIFRAQDVVMYATDHHKKSRIRVRIDGSKLNHYYCGKDFDVGINSRDIDSILNKVDKEYSSIILLSYKGNTQKNLSVVLENDIQIDETHGIDLVGQYNKMENESEFIDENYTIQFTWPGKYFRKTINDIKSISTQLSITQEDAESPLGFCYTSVNKKIHSQHIVKNPDKIKLISKLSDSDSFRVDVKIDYIKPISSSHIADEITIMVDENKHFMTKAIIDNGTIEIKTLTEIIDTRPTE